MKTPEKEVVANVSPTILRQFCCNPFEMPLRFGRGRLDYLEVTLEKVNRRYFKDHFELLGKYPCTNDAYFTLRVFSHKYTNATIYLLSEPRYENIVHPYKVRLNPIHFRSVADLVSVVQGLGADTDINHAIARVDYAVDLPSKYYPVMLVYLTVSISRKQCAERFAAEHTSLKRGRVNGFVLGKKPHRLSVYDVDVKEKNNGRDKPFVKLTRFELQVRKGTRRGWIPETIGELASVSENDPFADIYFWDVFRSEASLVESQKQKFFELQLLSLQCGFHNARSILNKMNRDFSRDYKKIVHELSVSRKTMLFRRIIRQSFRSSMRKWVDAPSAGGISS